MLSSDICQFIVLLAFAIVFSSQVKESTEADGKKRASVDGAGMDKDGTQTCDSQRSSEDGKTQGGRRKSLSRGDSLGNTPADHFESSPDKQRRDSGIGATPSHTVGISVVLSPSSSHPVHPSAALSEPEAAVGGPTRLNYGKEMDRSLMSDSGYARQSITYTRPGGLPAHPSYPQYPRPGPGNFSVKPDAYPVDGAGYGQSSGWPAQLGYGGQIGAPYPQQPVPMSYNSPRVGRRFSPAASGGATPATREIADDRLSLHSFDGSAMTEEGDPLSPEVAGRIKPDMNFATPPLHELYSSDQFGFKRTHSLQLHSGAVRRGRKKRRKFEEHNVRALVSAQQQRPTQSSQELPSSSEVFSAQSSAIPTIPASLAARSHLKSSSDDEQGGSLQRGGPGRGSIGNLSVGNLSLMEMTSEEQTAPGRPEVMPVVVHPIKVRVQSSWTVQLFERGHRWKRTYFFSV